MKKKTIFRVMSYNVNGLRASASKGLYQWLADQAVDVVCLQEIKAQLSQLSDPVFHPPQYRGFFRAATKKGYSGVAIYSRQRPDSIHTSLGWPAFDEEGRYLELRFGELSIVSLYLPSGSSGETRQAFKFEVMSWLEPLLREWLRSRRQYIVCGDWNIVRTSRDIRNWRTNQKNSGCLPAERDWMNRLCADAQDEICLEQAKGWQDTYRILHPEGEDYTWWSQRGAARANNVGWRIDYQLTSPSMRSAFQHCSIAKDVHFSDHAPYVVDYSI